MKANELRIGNLVYFLGNIHEIEGLSKRLRPDVGHFLLSNIEHAQKGFHLKPIPLTEEWLVKFGFVDMDNEGTQWSMNGPDCDFCLWTYIKGSNYTYNFENYQWQINPIKVKYVHQLQNLYFSLTGDELTITN